MGDNQENFEFTDPETGKVFPLNGASLVSNVRDILLSKRRQKIEATVWKALTEAQQKDEITAMQELARSLVGSVVERVAEKGLVCAHVEVGKFAVDVEKGEVTITAKGFASDDMLSDLAHSKGKVAKLTIVDAGQFNTKSTMVKPEKDQPSLLPDDEDQPDENDTPDTSAQLDDSDGLHDEDQSKPDAWSGGHQSRMAGYAQMRNPFTEGNGTPQQFEDWDSGWLEADQDEGAPSVDPDLGSDPAEAAEPDAETQADESATDVPDPSNDQDETEPKGEPATLEDTHNQGVDAARDGAGPDENPFDGGTDEYLAWNKGLTEGRKQIAELRKSGYDARGDGMAPTRCTWKKGTPEHGFWMQGYEQAKKDEQD